MARTIKPETPPLIESVNVKIPEMDFSVFDELGDEKIKSATQNFWLYANTTSKAQQQKLYDQYKNNPIALANALSKLPGMFKDLPESIQAELKKKLDTNAISLVQKAQTNQQKAIADENKALAQAGAVQNMSMLSDSFFNVLTYLTATEDEKRPLDVDIYKAQRAALEQLTTMTDENGKPLFNESQRAKMLMPKEAILAGFKQFINRAELEDLEAWYKDVFANQEKFINDTSIDADVYESMNTAIKARLKNLKDDKELGVHGQAYFDQINLISNPTQMNLEKAKSYEFTNDKVLDKAYENAKKVTGAEWYDPTKRTAPDAFIQAYNLFAEAVSDQDWSPEGREQAVAQAYVALGKLEDWAKQTNMSPEDMQQIRDMISTALTDREAQQVLIDTGFGKEFEENTLDTATNLKRVNPYNLSGQPSPFTDVVNKMRGGLAVKEAAVLANKNYAERLKRAVPYFLTRDMDNFREAVAYAAKEYKRDKASFIVRDGYEWERLERELAEGKKPIYNYEGRMLEFKGFDNRDAIFQEIF